jgi:hypothetical protein
MKIKYIWIGIILLILIGLAYLFCTIEGFQIIGKTNDPIPGFAASFSNVTGKSTTIVVNSNLKNLTTPSTLSTLATVETGINNPAYEVIDISDYTGKSLWSTGMGTSTLTTPNQYKLKFKSAITTTKFQEKLPLISANATWVGLDFTSPFILLQKEPTKWPKNDLSGTLWNLTDKYYLGILKTIGDGVSPTKMRNSDGIYTYPFDIENVQTTDGTNVWNKGYFRDTFGNTNKIGDKDTNMYTVNFSQPINLRSAKDIVKTKTIFSFVGLDPKDAPDRPYDISEGRTYYNTTNKQVLVTPNVYDVSNTLLYGQPTNFNPDSYTLTGGDANYTTSYSQSLFNSPDTTFTGATRLEPPTSEGGYASSAYQYPTYDDPAQTPVTPDDLSDLGGSSAPNMVTNRIKVRGIFQTIILPAIIESLQKGSNATVTEILNETGKPVWPATNPPYTGSGMPEVFTVGFNNKVDVPNTIQPYIQRYMPSITYLNPAMPRN